MRSSFFVVATLAACNRTPSTPGRPLASVAPSASASAAPVASALLHKPLPDGCWMEVDRAAEIGALTRALAAACAPGTRPLRKSDARAVAEGESLELSFTAPSQGLCVRAVAVGSPAIGDVELELSDGSGRRLGQGELEARFELVGPRGPVCVSAGPHRVRAVARRGAGELALEILVPTE